MSKKTILTAVLIAAGIGATGVAIASGPGSWHDGPRGEFRERMMQERFAAFDADGDGRVTEAEIEAYRQARFEDADRDGDGLLSQDEAWAQRERMREERHARRFAAMDDNGDGGLSLQETGGPADRMFARMDRNEDGAIDAEEFERTMGRRGGGWRGHGGPRWD